MRYALLISLCWLFSFTYGQDICSGTISEEITYRNFDSLCEEYGSLPPTVTVTNGLASNVTGGGWNNEIVAITGAFTIDIANFSIANCIVQMAPGATILVNNSNELNIDKSFLFSCNEMWEGIRVLSFGLLTISDSRIEDAQYAIYANSATGVKVLNNTFERKYKNLQ